MLNKILEDFKKGSKLNLLVCKDGSFIVIPKTDKIGVRINLIVTKK